MSIKSPVNLLYFLLIYFLFMLHVSFILYFSTPFLNCYMLFVTSNLLWLLTKFYKPYMNWFIPICIYKTSTNFIIPCFQKMFKLLLFSLSSISILQKSLHFLSWLTTSRWLSLITPIPHPHLSPPSTSPSSPNSLPLITMHAASNSSSCLIAHFEVSFFVKFSLMSCWKLVTGSGAWYAPGKMGLIHIYLLKHFKADSLNFITLNLFLGLSPRSYNQ